VCGEQRGTNGTEHTPIFVFNLIMSSYYHVLGEGETMKFQKLEQIPRKNPNVSVKVVEMGNIIETQYMSHKNCKQTIQMLKGGEQFVVCSTGEIKDIEHHETRKDNRKGLYKTFANIRSIVNTNVVDINKVRWCTLTYADKMTNSERLYNDFRKFNMRFQRYCKQKGYDKPEYIVIMEPQERGAWHAHLLYIWQDMKAPYIPNNDFRSLWGHGFVRIAKLDNVDNVGAYLTAYLGDMEIDEMNEIDALKAVGKQCKVVEVENEDNKKIKKAIVKGARLDLYPANFNMIRCSRGIKRPVAKMMSQTEANKKISDATKTFERAIKLIDVDNNFEAVIIKEQYNKIRNKNQ
jgi:hypothetical protein